MGSLFAPLPDELTTTILTLLPVDHLFRLKRVNKLWEELLSSFYFGKILSLSLSLPSHPSVLFLRRRDRCSSMFYATAFDLSSPFVLKKTEFQLNNMSRFRCSNGLVCCLVKSPRGKLSLNLGNPLSPRRMATPPKLNQRVATPPYLKQRKMVTLPKHYLELVSFGFHFNPIRKNFMILANFEYPRDETAFWVFDSVFGSWRLLENQPEIQYKNWKISDCVENKFYVFCPIMCYLEIFDVEREEWVGKYLPNLDKLTPIMQEWNGKLSLAHVTGDLQAHIWVLDEAKDWVEVFRQDLGEMGLKDQAIYARFLLGGTFFLSGNDKYVTIDVETGCSKVIPDHRAGLDFNFVRYQPTLCTFKKPSRRRKLKNKEKTH